VLGLLLLQLEQTAAGTAATSATCGAAAASSAGTAATATFSYYSMFGVVLRIAYALCVLHVLLCAQFCAHSEFSYVSRSCQTVCCLLSLAHICNIASTYNAGLPQLRQTRAEEQRRRDMGLAEFEAQELYLKQLQVRQL
jgi:hypothetical protein